MAITLVNDAAKMSMPIVKIQKTLESVDATKQWLKQWVSNYLHPPMVILLSGELGVGKTSFVQALLEARGYHDVVTSPTFNFLETYQIQGLDIYHFDLYRLANAEHLEYIGFSDYFVGQYICLIEWPERALDILMPIADLHIYFEYIENNDKRLLQMIPYSKNGAQLCHRIIVDIL